MFAATLDKEGEQIKTSKGRRELKNIIIKVLEEKLDEEEKTDEEKRDILKHTIEGWKFYNGDHETTEADQNENGEKNASGDDRNTKNEVQGNNSSLFLCELWVSYIKLIKHKRQDMRNQKL